MTADEKRKRIVYSSAVIDRRYNCTGARACAGYLQKNSVNLVIP